MGGHRSVVATGSPMASSLTITSPDLKFLLDVLLILLFDHLVHFLQRWRFLVVALGSMSWV